MGYIWDGVYSAFSKLGAGAQKPLRLTSQSSLATAMVESANTERLAAGKRFGGGCQTIANGIAPVTAIPTTTPSLGLYNTDTAGGRSLVVDVLHFSLGSGTPTAGATLLACVSNGAVVTAPSAATNYSSQCLNGNTGVAAKARWATTITVPVGSAWVAVQSSFQLAAANVGQGDVSFKLPGGGFLIQPGYALGVAILSGTGTTPLYLVSALWDEIAVEIAA